MLGLCCCAGFSLVVTSWGSSPVVVHLLLVAVASFVAERGLYGASVAVDPSSRVQAQ